MASLNGITWSGKPEFQVRNPSYNSTDLIIDLAVGHVWSLNCNNISGAIGTLTVQNVPSGTGIVSSFLLGLIQGPNPSSNYLNWVAMSNVKWAGGIRGVQPWQKHLINSTQMDSQEIMHYSNGHYLNAPANETTAGPNSMAPYRYTTTGTLPTGIALNTNYWCYFASNMYFFPSSTEVTSGEGSGSGTPIPWTNAGTGTHYWHMYSHEKNQNIQTATDNAVDYLSFTTWDNGTTWYGTVVGRDIK
jgi:hypothetical protein